jgi:hypothetical protein
VTEVVLNCGFVHRFIQLQYEEGAALLKEHGSVRKAVESFNMK